MSLNAKKKQNIENNILQYLICIIGNLFAKTVLMVVHKADNQAPLVFAIIHNIQNNQ